MDDPARVLVEDGDNAFILNGLNRDGLKRGVGLVPLLLEFNPEYDPFRDDEGDAEDEATNRIESDFDVTVSEVAGGEGVGIEREEGLTTGVASLFTMVTSVTILLKSDGNFLGETSFDKVSFPILNTFLVFFGASREYAGSLS